MFGALRGLYNSLWLQRLLVLFTIAVTLYYVQFHIGGVGWLIWILFVPVLLLEYLAYWRGINMGIVGFSRLTAAEKEEVLKLLDEISNG
jgi:hypothetical protein